VSPRHLRDLERHERRREILRLVLRVVVIAVVLLAAYYLLPVMKLSGGAAIVSIVVNCLLLVLVVLWLARRITRSDLPELRAVEVIVIAVPLFLYVFASSYLAMSEASAAAFSEPLNRTGALYLAVTVFSTVGFGDITPKTDVARIVTSLQMVFDIVLLGVLVRLIIGAARIGLSRGSEPTKQSDESEP
jgi:hypothetical protein